MAEGDTIARIARRLEQALAGSAVAVTTPGPRGPQGRPASELDGDSLLGAESRGKHLLVRFAGGLVLHSHLGMRGSWDVHRPGQRWRHPRRSAWIAITGERGEAVNFNGSSLRIVRDAELARDPRLARLGPDVLDPGEEPPALAAALRSRARPETELGEALLDQAAIAGIGNIFKSEGCFAARVDPRRRLGDLGAAELEAVVAATRELMLAAVRTGRSDPRVYRRAGRPCPVCRGPVASRAQGDSARITYWCPRCQR